MYLSTNIGDKLTDSYKCNLRLVILCQSCFFWEFSVHRAILRQEEAVEVLQVPKALSNIFKVVIRGMVDIQINIFSVCLFARE